MNSGRTNRRLTLEGRGPTVAERIRQGMAALEGVMQTGRPPHETFTVRTAEIADPAAYTPADVRRVRERLGVSQRVFARLAGVSPHLVRSWEQGKRPPALWARRLFDVIRADPGYWTNLVRQPRSRIPTGPGRGKQVSSGGKATAGPVRRRTGARSAPRDP